MTSAAKVRYLRLLGFESTTETADTQVDRRHGPTAGAESVYDTVEPTRDQRDNDDKTSGSVKHPAPPGPNDQKEVQIKRESRPNSHVLWRHADGEWVRGGRGLRPGASRPGTHHSLSVAGTVAIETETELEAVWTRFKAQENQQDRDELIVYYAPLVKYVASRIAAGLPQTVDQSDLISYGMFGLIDAITKFDPERGFKFETYAVSRIKGAILDELRSIDWVPRSVRSKAKAVERAMAKLEAKLHRPPTDSEIAEELDLTSDQLSGVYKQIGSLGMVALDEMLSAGGTESLTFGDTLADRRDGPGMTYERSEVRQLLARAINTMSEREKIVLTLYYYENMTLAEIGKVLGVTESRVCQIHTKAVFGLRSRMESAEREPA